MSDSSTGNTQETTDSTGAFAGLATSFAGINLKGAAAAVVSSANEETVREETSQPSATTGESQPTDFCACATKDTNAICKNCTMIKLIPDLLIDNIEELVGNLSEFKNNVMAFKNNELDEDADDDITVIKHQTKAAITALTFFLASL